MPFVRHRHLAPGTISVFHTDLCKYIGAPLVSSARGLVALNMYLHHKNIISFRDTYEAYYSDPYGNITTILDYINAFRARLIVTGRAIPSYVNNLNADYVQHFLAPCENPY